MKLYVLLATLIIGCITFSCTKSPKQQAETATQQVNPLEKVFKEALAQEKNLYDLVRMNIIKERIITEYSQKFYDKFFHYVQVVPSISYEDNMYKCEGWEAHLSGNIAKLTYNPTNDQLIASLTLEGRIVQPDGNIHYNTEGWEQRYDKDEFDEDIKSQPMAYYDLVADYNLVPYHHICIIIAKGGMILSTNDFVYSSANISKILIKDNDSGKVYNIAFDETYYQGGGAGSMRYNEVGVIMRWENISKFVNIVTSLTNYSIAFINENDENKVVKNPKDLKNIRDAIQKFVIDKLEEFS